ncbi:hypothetical protein ACHAXT_000557 [Thalassiosira profunda]
MPSAQRNAGNTAGGGPSLSGKPASAFSLMNSLKGGSAASVSASDADSTARLREGLSAGHPPAHQPTQSARAPPSPGAAQSAAYNPKPPAQHRRTASYRAAPKGSKGAAAVSPSKHKRSQSGGGRWNFPSLSLSPSKDSGDNEDQMSARGSVTTAATNAGAPSLRTSSFDDCYAPPSPGYHDAFALLDGVERSSFKVASPRGNGSGRALFPSPQKSKDTNRTAPASPRHAHAPQAAQTTIDGRSPTRGSDGMASTSSPPGTPPHQQTAPAPPSGSKSRRSASPIPFAGRRSASPIPFAGKRSASPTPFAGKSGSQTGRSASPISFGGKSGSQTGRSASPVPFAGKSGKQTTRAASPLRHPSPLSGGASRVKKSLANKFHVRSRSRGSGNYSDAVSQALQEEAAGKEIAEKSKSSQSAGTKSAGTAKSQEGVEVISGPSTPRSGRGVTKSGRRMRNRSPSPARKTTVKATTAEGANNGTTTNDAHFDKGSTASTPSFFGAPKGMRAISPGRVKRKLKQRLQRPPGPKPPSSPTKRPLPLHPGSESARGEGSAEDDDDDIDQITSLVHTTLSFDITDGGLAVEPTNIPESRFREKVEPLRSPKRKGAAQAAIQENDMDEDGYFINTVTFNIFESQEFLRAMGGSASEASLATNYLRTGDSLCEGKETGHPQFERAVQDYYAGLGVILSRVREWMLDRRGESDIPADEAPDASETTHILYKDLLEVAHSPETNVLLLAMSSILLRAGNARFRLQQYEQACHDYGSAEAYRALRHEAKDIIASEEAEHTDVHVEDAKLHGRISNNLAAAKSKRNLHDEARREYTKALQIKQVALEKLHKSKGGAADNDGTKKETNEKNLVADIASTFHNIGLLRLECEEPKKAEKAYKQSLSLRVKKFGLDNLGVSATLSALGDVYYRQRQYDDAFRSYKEALRIWKANRRHSDARTAELYYNIGLVFRAKGPLAKARTSAAECLRIRRQVYGDDGLPVASALYLLGFVAQSEGNYDEAMSLLEEALAIRQKSLASPDQLSVLNVQLAQGMVHQKRNDLDSAMHCFEVVLEGRTERLGQDHASVAEVLQAVGATYAAAGEYDKAYQTLEEALRIRRASSGPSVEVAETLDSLSVVLFKSGDSEKAVELSEEALDMLKTTAGLDHLLVGEVLKHAGDIYQEAEAFDDAMEAYSESLRVMTHWYGREHLFLAEVLNEIGVTRFKSGEYMIAKQSFTEALRLMRLSHNEANQSAIYPTLNHLGHALYKNKELELAAETYIESFNIQVSIVTGDASDGLKEFGRKLSTIKDRVAAMARANDDVTEISESLGGIASILRYLALVIQEQGDFESALSTNKLSLSVRLCQPIRENAAIALIAETIAIAEYKRNNPDSAMDYFHQALEAKKAYQGEQTIDVSRTLNNLANIHFSLGHLDEAMELYQEALEIKRHCLGEDSDEVANTLNNIAHVMVNAGKAKEALEAYHNVVKIRQDRYGKSHPSVAATLASMGDVYIQLGKLEIAMTYFEQCIRIQKLHQDHCDERILENLGSIYGKLGEWHKAESTFREIIATKRAARGDDCLDVAKTLDLLAVSYIEQDRYADSIEHLEEALRIRRACLDEEDDEVLASLNKLAFVYKKLDMTEEMLKVRAEFDAIQAGRRED